MRSRLHLQCQIEGSEFERLQFVLFHADKEQGPRIIANGKCLFLMQVTMIKWMIQNLKTGLETLNFKNNSVVVMDSTPYLCTKMHSTTNALEKRENYIFTSRNRNRFSRGQPEERIITLVKE